MFYINYIYSLAWCFITGGNKYDYRNNSHVHAWIVSKY